jgi:hypothetical protein
MYEDSHGVLRRKCKSSWTRVAARPELMATNALCGPSERLMSIPKASGDVEHRSDAEI